MTEMRMNAPVNRLIGDMPKIGIRPTIDGRREGVRESLEGQTMTMARAAARFLEAHLRHANGLPVECVIADSCIGGVAEAAQTAAKFAREGVGVSLTVTPAWCYGAETMDMDPHTPKAIWGFNGTERPGAVYLAAVLAAHRVYSGGCTGEAAAVRAGGPGGGADAGQVVPVDGGHVDGYRRFDRGPGFFRAVPGDARRAGGYDGVCAADGGGDL